MKKSFLLLSAVMVVSCSRNVAQGIAMDDVLARQVVESDYIHSPLPLDMGRSSEALGLKKTVIEEIPLQINPEEWSAEGIGELSFVEEGAQSVRMSWPTTTGVRAKGSPDDPDYATYGRFEIRCNLGGKDLIDYNRVYFKILPDCPGMNVVNVDFHIPGNAGHLINLVDGEWNECCLEIADIDRSSPDHISFSAAIRGSDCFIDTTSCLTINDIRFQKIENPEKTMGWEPEGVVYATSGYMASSPKIAIADTAALQDGGDFCLKDSRSGRVAYRGRVRKTESSIGSFSIIDFSDFDGEGRYRLCADGIETQDFLISDRLWTDSQWKALNFIFCQRCGCEVPGIHSECHRDLFAVHGDEVISFGGGWHDAGDLSQQALQTADVSFNLLEASEAMKFSNPVLSDRLKEEALWGIDFCLSNRFSDGYRASSVGLLIWQDGLEGSFDDISTVRVHNLAFDNFLYSGYEAYAAMTLDDEDYKSRLKNAAVEDFRFASEKFASDGFDKFLHLYEHTYNTSHSQYMATVSWAASMLYRLTGEERYAVTASESIRHTIACQQKEPISNGMRGFFYRDESRRSIVHYIHQSREQLYMMALEALMETQPGHVDYAAWKESMALYGEYLKSMMVFTYPYGMIPSGLYLNREYEDEEGFKALHLFAPEDARERYDAQLQAGVKIDSCHYVKRFPVWFNIFNGNSAVMLSAGKAAAICGRVLGDKVLTDIAREQLYWMTGKNPFGESIIYGEGWNYPSMDSFSSGEITGEMPVGIRTTGDGDIPCWPQVNNACYKEVWTVIAGKWLSLVSEMVRK